RVAVSGLGERIDLATLEDRHLRDEMGGGAESVDPQALGPRRHRVRAVPDEPGAEQRRRVRIVELGRDLEAVALIGDRVTRVAAVVVEAREARALAEVLASREAVIAAPARPAEP